MCTKSSHRHSIFCILPPHILREIVLNGDDDQRLAAMNTLSIDSTMRLTRATSQMVNNTSQQGLIGTDAPVVQRTIYSAASDDDNDPQMTLPGTVIRSEGDDASDDPAINEAYDGLGATFDFYLSAFNRNSIDNQGMHLDATVHFGRKFNNAFWNGRQMVFGDGDPRIFNRFTLSLDVIGHELTHGVTGSEAQLVYLGEAGALNESLSDVFGSLIKQSFLNQTADEADWLIGKELFSDGHSAVRSLKAPGTAFNQPLLGKDPQPAKMSKFVRTSNDHGGVHINSGIPNHAFYLLATALGGHAWEKAGRVWYETLLDPRLSTTATFIDFARLSVVNATRLFPDDNTKQAVIDAWNGVELNVG